MPAAQGESPAVAAAAAEGRSRLLLRNASSPAVAAAAAEGLQNPAGVAAATERRQPEAPPPRAPAHCPLGREIQDRIAHLECEFLVLQNESISRQQRLEFAALVSENRELKQRMEEAEIRIDSLIRTVEELKGCANYLLGRMSQMGHNEPDGPDEPDEPVVENWRTCLRCGEFEPFGGMSEECCWRQYGVGCVFGGVGTAPDDLSDDEDEDGLGRFDLPLTRSSPTSSSRSVTALPTTSPALTRSSV